MNKHIQKLREHKFKVHLAVFLTAMAASLGLYFAAQQGSSVSMWGLLGIVVLGNLVAVVV